MSKFKGAGAFACLAATLLAIVSPVAASDADDRATARQTVEWLRDAALAAGLLRTRFKYEEVAEMSFAEQVSEEDPPAL